MRLFLIAILLVIGTVGKAAIADTTLLYRHVLKITEGPGYRNYQDLAALNRTADYIRTELGRYGSPVEQTFSVSGNEYKNIILSFGPVDAPRIVIGAHYDVCNEQAGADDNASGVAGLLELARLLAAGNPDAWKYRIDLVAYTLEEPPFYGTANMGSAVHAKYLYDNKVPVKGMISLEMIGYFRDEKHTQNYPAGILKPFYGSRGNYITLVHKFGGGSFVRQFTRSFRKQDGDVITKVFKGPAWIPGVDFSDHRNYWPYGWPALMITDTAFYRNAGYHEKTDTPDSLDYYRMAAVVTKLYETLKDIAV